MYSKIIKQDVVASNKSKTGFVFVSTCDTFDEGLETMVFDCDEYGNVSDWGENDCQRYESKNEAIAGHDTMLISWK